ncbi:MAG: transporter substrate-binding domain-containing protein, partial [Muribaculaceae bacterium]|nr:transporter substrate-binding domain-containing protein [Muribaculaceae bacterium]
MALQRLPEKKSRPAILIAILIGILLLMFGMKKCSNHDYSDFSLRSERIKSGGDTLDIAIEMSPLSYSMSGDSVSGLDYELLTTLSTRHGRPIKFHPFVPLKHATEGLRQGLYDIVVSALPATDSLKAEFLLTDKVFLDREVLVQLHGSQNFIPTPEDLIGDTVWIAAGSPFKQRIRNLAAESGDTIIVIEADGRSAEQLVILVAKGRIPRAVVNERVASKMKKMKYHQLDYSVPVSFTQFQTWALSKDNEALRDTINAWLADFRETPAYDAILTRY